MTCHCGAEVNVAAGEICECVPAEEVGARMMALYGLTIQASHFGMAVAEIPHRCLSKRSGA